MIREAEAAERAAEAEREAAAALMEDLEVVMGREPAMVVSQPAAANRLSQPGSAFRMI